MGSPFQYDPNLVSVIAGGKILGGWGEGTYIEAERDEDSWMKKTGVDGEVSRAKNKNRGGKVTLTLMQTSPSNDILSAFQQADEQAGTGVFTIVVRDANGATLLSAADAWVKKPPKLVFAKEVQAWQWTIDIGTFAFLVGAGTN
jgi:hypothetical protein